MTGIFFLAIYVGIFLAAFFIITKVVQKGANDYTSLKTVTFGDESAVRPNRFAGVISVLTIFLMWGIFTGSSLIPSFLHAPGPFVGNTSFTYTAEANGETDDATVSIIVHPREEQTKAAEVEGGEGFAKDDSVAVAQWRTKVVNVAGNDEISKKDGNTVIAINGQKIAPGETVQVDGGSVTLTDKGTPGLIPSWNSCAPCRRWP